MGGRADRPAEPPASVGVGTAGPPTGGPAPETAAAFLRRLPLFHDLRPADLERLAGLARRVRAEAGEVLFREGTPGDGLYLIVDGELEVTTSEGGSDIELARRGPGEFLGEMSLLEQVPRSGTVRAVRPSELLVIAPAEFQSLIAGSPDAAAMILRTIAGRLRSTESMLMAREKLASLGTLAAGLAHELNNPAAAIRRSAAELGRVLGAARSRAAEVGALSLSPDQAAALRDVEGEIATCPATDDDPLACSAREEEVAEWLEIRLVDEPWELAPAFVAYGWGVRRLEELAERFRRDQLPAILGWLGAGFAARQLQDEIELSAGAIAAIVGAVRAYSYLDRAPIQEVSLADSIEATLVILRHKLRQGVEVVRSFPAGLPRIEAYGSELNQVWTNLIDNAIDAMDGVGRLEIGARVEPDCVVVRISDTGPGIPEELRDRVFEPFFTTKPPGVGSGLGLHIVHNIVVTRHHGRLRLESGDHGTTVEVSLPLRLDRSTTSVEPAVDPASGADPVR